MGPFEEEEEGIGIASDVVKVQGEHPSSAVFDTRKPRHRKDSPI